MPVARLCVTCYESIHSAAEKTQEWRRSYVRIEHHPSLQSLRIAADYGCPICRWLLHQGLPNHNSTESVSSRLETVRTYHHPVGVDDIILEFKIYDKEGSVFAVVKIYAVPVGEIEADVTEGVGVLDQAAKWLHTCAQTHHACNPGSSDGERNWRPSRLLYICSQEKTLSMRLVEAARDEYEPGVTYTALSHRWSNDELTLTEDRIADFRKDIPVSLLKRAIRDAAQISLNLGVCYIWVDTLCIMQDSRADKDLEISRMELVYGACCCNISAPLTLDEIAKRREGELSSSISSYNVALDMDRWMVGAPTMWKLRLDWNDKELKESVLSSRAWVYQERYLSPRILSICEDQVYWECSQLIASESFPEGKDQPFTAFTFGLAHDPLSKPASTTFNDWYSIVWDYTRGNLTFDEDKLRALAGVARLYEKTFNFEYLFGIWRESMPHALLWEVLIRSRPGRRLKGIAPTWSWASVVGKIGIAWLTHGNPDAVSTVTILPMSATSMDILWPTTLHDKSPLLLLRGPLWKARVSAEYDHTLRGLDNCECLLRQDDDGSLRSWQEAILSMTLDCEELLPLDVVCLPIMGRNPAYFPDGLILSMVDDECVPPVYRRVGIYQGRKVTGDLLEEMKTCELVIC